MNMIEADNLSQYYRIARRDRNLVKYLFSREYDIKKALDGVSFNISKGELVGYIGANGAGKSTTIKILTGILVPTGGQARVLGNIPHVKRKQNAAQIGVVFGQRTQLWWDLPLVDSFELLRRMYRVPVLEYNKKIKYFTEILELDSFINTPVRQLSLGQRMRADIVASLLHNPQILFLDEPTIGLDIVAKKNLRQFIKKMRNEYEITVILTTHDMKDIEEICGRMILIDKGKKVLDMKIEDVHNKFGGINTLIVDFDSEPENISVPYLTLVSKDGPRWTFTFERDMISSSEAIFKISSLCQVRDVSLKEPDIEDIVRDIYTGKCDVVR